MVNLELYRIFTIVANEENLTKASKILHISHNKFKELNNLVKIMKKYFTK